MANLPTENNNPGDLRFVGQEKATQGKGGFASFPTPQDGFGALLNQIQTNINNKPNETLADFSNSYAPSSDGNNSAKYAADLANQLGVSPDTAISTLQPQIGKFADAIAQNEGYQINQTEQSNGGASVGQTALGVGLGAGAVGLGLLGRTPILPVAGAALGGAGGALLGGPAGAVVGEGIGAGLGSAAEGLLGGNSQQTQAVAPPQSTPTSDIVNNLLSQTIGGNKTMQEAQNRGISNVGSILEQNGLLPGVDENGNYDKISPTLKANSLIGEMGDNVSDLASGMHSQTSLADAEKLAEDEARAGMGVNDPLLSGTLAKIKKTFEGYGEQFPQQTDKEGKQLSSSQRFKPVSELLKMKQLASHGENWATDPHDKSASQYIKTALGKHLTVLAHNEGKGKEWEAAHRRMEELFVAKKAIKHLPKKAQRDRFKEFKKDLIASLVGGGIAHTLGKNSLAGAVIGHLIETQLSHKEYKQLGKDFQRAEKPEGLLSRKSPRQKERK